MPPPTAVSRLRSTPTLERVRVQRGIVVLDWGPTNLAFTPPPSIPVPLLYPGWIERGPELPEFLDTPEVNIFSNVNQKFRTVRFAFSALDSLFEVIENLKQCFNFQFAESIGYLDVRGQTASARREHRGILGILRQWLTRGGADAVVWVDFDKPDFGGGLSQRIFREWGGTSPDRSRSVFSPAHWTLVGDAEVSRELMGSFGVDESSIGGSGAVGCSGGARRGSGGLVGEARLGSVGALLPGNVGEDVLAGRRTPSGDDKNLFTTKDLLRWTVLGGGTSAAPGTEMGG